MMDKLEGHRDPQVSAERYGGKPHIPAKKIIRAVIRFEDGTGAEMDVEGVHIAGNAESADIGRCVRESLSTGSELIISGRVRKLRISAPFGEKS